MFVKPPEFIAGELKTKEYHTGLKRHTTWPNNDKWAYILVGGAEEGWIAVAQYGVEHMLSYVFRLDTDQTAGVFGVGTSTMNDTVTLLETLTINIKWTLQTPSISSLMNTLLELYRFRSFVCYAPSLLSLVLVCGCLLCSFITIDSRRTYIFECK